MSALPIDLRRTLTGGSSHRCLPLPSPAVNDRPSKTSTLSTSGCTKSHFGPLRSSSWLTWSAPRVSQPSPAAAWSTCSPALAFHLKPESVVDNGHRTISLLGSTDVEPGDLLGAPSSLVITISTLGLTGHCDGINTGLIKACGFTAIETVTAGIGLGELIPPVLKLLRAHHPVPLRQQRFPRLPPPRTAYGRLG